MSLSMRKECHTNQRRLQGLSNILITASSFQVNYITAPVCRHVRLLCHLPAPLSAQVWYQSSRALQQSETTVQPVLSHRHGLDANHTPSYAVPLSMQRACHRDVTALKPAGS